jgi:AraC-like DNA-binding protein
MQLRHILPRAELQPYITKIWLLETERPVLSAANSLIVPNARMKLMISCQGDLYTTDRHKTAVCTEGDVCLIGLRDMPVSLHAGKGPSASIGVEFTTAGTHKFSSIPMHELRNDLFSLSDLFGIKGRELIEQIGNAKQPQEKLDALQDFLINQLRNEGRDNTVVDYLVNTIRQSNGLVEISTLERTSGYSRRYLNMLFQDHLGVSPKTLAMLVRFQSFYKDARHWNELYYDQSHFIRNFRHHTGLTPQQYLKIGNDFGKRF